MVAKKIAQTKNCNHFNFFVCCDLLKATFISPSTAENSQSLKNRPLHIVKQKKATHASLYFFTFSLSFHQPCNSNNISCSSGENDHYNGKRRSRHCRELHGRWITQRSQCNMRFLYGCNGSRYGRHWFPGQATHREATAHLPVDTAHLYFGAREKGQTNRQSCSRNRWNTSKINFF